MALAAPVMAPLPLIRTWRRRAAHPRRFAARAAEKRAALIPYITAGFPDPSDTVPMLEAAADAGADVTPETLVEKGVLKNTKTDVKILGNGDLKKQQAVTAHAVSASAREKIEAAGGTITLLREPKERKPKRRQRPAGPAQPEAEAPADQPEAEAEPAAPEEQPEREGEDR